MNGTNKYKRSVLCIAVAVALAVISVIVAILVMAFYTPAQKKCHQAEVLAVDEDGNAIKNGQEMPKCMAFVRTSAAETIDGVQTYADSVTVTAAIIPDDAMYSSPTWSLAWKDTSVTESVSSYVTVSQSPLNPLSVTLACKKAFSNKIVLTFSVKDYYNNEFTKSCELNYLDHITGIDYITARYKLGTDYNTYSPLPYNRYTNTSPCEVDAFYYGSASSVKYELGEIVLRWSGGTIKGSDIEEISMRNLRIQYSVSYNNGWVSKVKEFTETTELPYLDFCEIIESLPEKKQILAASNNRPLVRVMFAFTNWTSSDNYFDMDFRLDYNSGISSVALSKISYTF